VSTLTVLGNISRDCAIYPGGRRFEMLGGAALHVARAASSGGLTAAPVSVIGTDLAWLRGDPRLSALDVTSIKVLPGPSCAFTLSYTSAGELTGIDCTFGVAESLTGHCLAAIGRHRQYHVCCRRPLGVPAVLSRLASAGLVFSTDFHLASAGEVMGDAAAFLPHATVVFVNAAEFTTLAALADPARLAAVVISDGPREVTLLRHGKVTATAQPPDRDPVEVTGAGDTLAGTFLASLARGLGDVEALTAAVAAATDSTRGPSLAIGSR
jgi:sugar/nucleoside kinase (ribokinase family)